MKRAALFVSLLLAGLLVACAAKEYPVRDDHDHTPGPALTPLNPPQSDAEGG